MESHLLLKGITNVHDQLLLESICQGVRSFFEWALLQAGGFSNVEVSTPGTNDPYADELLHPVHFEGVADNTIWESIHTDWVYETGLDVSPLPQSTTGVYVNGTLYPTASTTGTYKHYINFKEGRVVFDSAIPATSLVQCAYSYRWINIYDHEVPWFREVIFDDFVISDTKATNVVSLMSQNRVQMPAIVIEPVMRRRQRPMMLGSGAHWVEQDLLFHILTERGDERNNIMDIISLQKDKTFYLYDVNARREDNAFGLDWRGSPIDNAKSYPEIVAMPPSGYRWKSCFFSRMTPQDVTLRLPLYRAIVRVTLEVDFNSI